MLAHAFLAPTQTFVIATGVLLTGYFAIRATGPRRAPAGRLGSTVGAVLLVAVASSVGFICYIARAHPYAAQDPTHVFTVILTLVLTG